MSRIGCLVLWLAVLNSSNLYAQDPFQREESIRLAVPDAAAQSQAATLIANLFKSEYDTAKTPQQRSELAKKMLEVGKDSKDDITGRYVLFRIARDIAADVGDTPTALEAIGLMESMYLTNGLSDTVDALSRIVNSLKLPKEHQELAKQLQALTRKAISKDRFDEAKRINAIALESARQARSAELVKAVDAQGKEITVAQVEFQQVEAAVERLKTAPTDPAANLVVGKYRCLVRGDWENGLLMLALGSDSNLKKLAEAELAERPDALTLGNSWWDYGDSASGETKTAVKDRAAYWYQKASYTANGLSKRLVETRLAEMGVKSRSSAAVPFSSSDPIPTTTVATPEASTASYKTGEWESLMDGKNLRAWKADNQQVWKVTSDGFTASGGRSHMFYTARKFTDVEVEVDVKCEDGSNGGVYIRAGAVKSTGSLPVSGYEAQAQQESPNHRTGTIYRNNAKVGDVGKQLNKTGEWFALGVVLQDGQMTVYVNGEKASEFTDTDPLTEGYIAVQCHGKGGTVHYRNLRVRELIKEE